VRDAEARLGAQPAALELGHRRVEVANPVNQHRRISLQVLGQQEAGPPPVSPTCATRVTKASMAKRTSAPMTPVVPRRVRRNE
jgi:hypothetical protein